ncbi:MAG: hypothetical protein DVB26_01225 [Verrucomicrobia bacterium]|nr:MAG: hypothetical protein DVB26_01225 [Verrucomicrobiota bacterium]
MTPKQYGGSLRPAELIVLEGSGAAKRHCLEIAAELSGHTLTDLLALHGFQLTTRCGLNLEGALEDRYIDHLDLPAAAAF